MKEGAEILKNLGVEIIVIENSGDRSANVSTIINRIQKAVK